MYCYFFLFLFLFLFLLIFIFLFIPRTFMYKLILLWRDHHFVNLNLHYLYWHRHNRSGYPWNSPLVFTTKYFFTLSFHDHCVEDLRGPLKRAGVLVLINNVRNEYGNSLNDLTLSRIQPSLSQSNEPTLRDKIMDLTFQIESNLGMHSKLLFK